MEEFNLPILTVLVGLQCSGKSTKAKELKDNNTIILASDEYRKEHPEWSNESVFKNLYADMNKYLEKGNDVIIDATNLTIKSRLNTLRRLKVKCFKKCLIMNTPYEECIERLKIRNQQSDIHHVPEEALKRYLHSFEIPFYEEGWDSIVVNREIDIESSNKWQEQMMNMAKDFDQHNKHHTKNLLDHMSDVGTRVFEITHKSRDCRKTLNQLLILSGYWHDIGKLFTQTYKENDPNAHYYQHANVGTYYLLCNSGIYELQESPIENEPDWVRYDKDKTLIWLFYVNYHMHIYNMKSEKSISKWKAIFGEEAYKNLEIINQADKGEY